MNNNLAAWRVVGGVAGALAILVGGYLALTQGRYFDPVPTLLLALLAFALQATDLRAVEANVSLTSILLGAAIALSGPLGAAVVGLASTWATARSGPLLPTLFNALTNALTGVVGGLAFLAAGGVIRPGSGLSPLELLQHELLPLGVATVVMLACNVLCVGLVISVTGGPSVPLTARRLIQQVGRTYLGYGVVAFLAVVLWGAADLGPASMVVILVPLVCAQWSYRQQHAETISHERTVAGLAAAVDARDPALTGRNRQVAAVSELIGDRLRLVPNQSEALHYAALLHDVGMVAPAQDRHGDRSRLQPDDLERIRRHPELGGRMLDSIAFLADSIPAIRAHHERWDGQGYPTGLSGPDIPLLARILAVADAVCALVAADPEVGVPGALAQVQSRAGSQFDPACVAALTYVEADLERVLGPDSGIGASAGATVPWDHDLPTVSDLLAARATAAG